MVGEHILIDRELVGRLGGHFESCKSEVDDIRLCKNVERRKRYYCSLSAMLQNGGSYAQPCRVSYRGAGHSSKLGPLTLDMHV